MASKFFVDQRGALREYSVRITERGIRFPVCLAIRHGGEVTEECPDFLLDLQKAEVSVRTAAPLPKGSTVMLHFYIPPETKLLAGMKGVVTAVNDAHHADGPGMNLRLLHDDPEALALLEAYLEERIHLIDEVV